MKRHTPTAALRTLAGGLIWSAVAVVTTSTQAAVAPLSQAALKKKSDVIVSGKVIAVTSKVRKSTHENSAGIHHDQVYSIQLQVASTSKGTGIKSGQKLSIQAWQPSVRVPPLPGLQGHVPIPAQGDMVRMFLLHNAKARRYEPLLPNGIEITKAADRLERNYVQRAKLSAAQESTVIALAEKCGIQKVASISTHNMYPTPFRGIRVHGAESVNGREVSVQVLSMSHSAWLQDGAAARRGDQQIGNFWAGKPYTRKQTILKVNQHEYRTGPLQGVTIKECETILGLFLAGKYQHGPTVQKRSLAEVDWTRPLRIARRGDRLSAGFAHKNADGGFFDLELSLNDGQLTIKQMFQAVP